MQYFGLVGGELGVVSKVDPLETRPACPELWRVAAVPTGTGWPNTSVTAEAESADADGVGAALRAGGGLLSTPRNSNSPGSTLLDSRRSTRNRRGELFTAAGTPVTKPVEGPEPPAWLESRSGLLREPPEGGVPSAASLASVGACHGGSTTVSAWTSPGVQVLDSKSCSLAGSSGGGSSGGGVLGGGDDESSAFALSFTSAPWTVSDDEASEGAGASNLGPIKGAGERRAAKLVRAIPKPAVRKKASYRRRKRGRLPARSGGGGDSGGGDMTQVPPAAQRSSKTDAALVPGGNQRERERDAAQHPTDDSINSGADGGGAVRKPQPELYDVWIPQRVFQGKGLPTLKRVKGGVEPHPQRSPRSKATQAAGEKKLEGDNSPTAKPPNHGVDSPSGDRHQLASGQPRQRKQILPAPDKRCAVHYVGEPGDFAKEHAAPPPQALGDGTTSAHAAHGERAAIVSFAGATHDTEGNEVEVEAKAWSVGGDDGDDDDRGGSFWGDDTRGGKSVLVGDAAAVAARRDGGGSIVRWQEQEGEQERGEREQDDDEYFDYAKIFSWQTAAEVVKQAEAETHGGGHQDGGVTEVRLSRILYSSQTHSFSLWLVARPLFSQIFFKIPREIVFVIMSSPFP